MGFVGSARNILLTANNAISVTLSGVLAGDVIIATQGYFFNNGPTLPVNYTCFDSDGNAYDVGTWSTGPGFGQVVAFRAIAQFDGSITITMTEDVARAGRYILVANLRDVGKFVQTALQAFPYGVTGGDGNQTGFYNIADTWTVSLFYTQVGTPVTDPGGVSAVADAPSTAGTGYSQAELYMFVEHWTGPGFQQTRIKTTPGGAVSTHPMMTLVFSKPLADDPDDNTAILPGCGEQHYNPAASGFSGPENVPATNRPLDIVMPRRPQLGSFVWGGMALGSASSGFQVQSPDDYGNTWVTTDASPGFGDVCIVRLFYTIIRNLPPVGEVFKVRLTADATLTDTVYQVAAIGIKEKRLTAPPVNYALYKWDHDILADPEITPITTVAVNVPIDTYLVAFGAFAPSGLENSIAWTALGTWNIIEKSEFVCEPFTITNDPRIMPCVLMDQVSTGGNYDARVKGTVTTSPPSVITESASIAMLAITIPSNHGAPEYVRRRAMPGS